MKNQSIFLALIAVACLLPPPLMADARTDAGIRKKLLGFWRSPRHEYEFKSDGIVYMRPTPPCTTTDKWKVKDGHFIWGRDSYVIVSLTDKKFVYKSPSDKNGKGYIMKKITKKMVGQSYEPSSVK